MNSPFSSFAIDSMVEVGERDYGGVGGGEGVGGRFRVLVMMGGQCGDDYDGIDGPAAAAPPTKSYDHPWRPNYFGNHENHFWVHGGNVAR